MLILSKYHDYYDTAIGVGGIDKTLIYKRDKILVNEPYPGDKDTTGFSWWYDSNKLPSLNNTIRNSSYRKGNANCSLIDTFLIYFCGKSYFGFRYVEFPFINLTFNKEDMQFVYDVDKMLPLIDRYFETLTSDFFKGKNKEEYKKDFINVVKKHHDTYHNKTVNLDVFRKHNTPCYLQSTWLYEAIRTSMSTLAQTEINPVLKDLGFMKIMIPPQAFQEIEMFLGGVIANREKEIIELSEKDRLAQHGMNKWSFRNPDPPKRKQK